MQQLFFLMKKTTLIILLIYISKFIISQNSNNIVIFTDEILPFYVLINGVKQNKEANTNVKITGLKKPNVSISILFKENIPEIKKTVWYESMGKELTLKIVSTKKGYRLRYFGEVDAENSIENKDQTIITYNTNKNTSVKENKTHDTKISSKYNTDNIVSDTINNYQTNINNDSISDTVYVKGYRGNIGCSIPENNIIYIKNSIKNEVFSDRKMNFAKKTLKNKCLTTNQIKEIMNLFTYEDKKLEFAKYIYSKTYDIDNFYLLNNLFNLKSTKDNLNEFLNSK